GQAARSHRAAPRRRRTASCRCLSTPRMRVASDRAGMLNRSTAEAIALLPVDVAACRRRPDLSVVVAVEHERDNLDLLLPAVRDVISSEVIEHVSDTPEVWQEVSRVLRLGGFLILGTPDYGRPLWWLLEWIYGKVLPEAYADEHITRYTHREIVRRLHAADYEILDCRYVGFCEMIFKARKRGAAQP